MSRKLENVQTVLSCRFKEREWCQRTFEKNWINKSFTEALFFSRAIIENMEIFLACNLIVKELTHPEQSGTKPSLRGKFH